MHAVCEDFDKYFSAWNQDVYRLCFAMVGKAGDARDLTFKTFLRLGAAKDPEMKEKTAKNLLFSSCFTLCVDSFGQKMRRMPNRKALEAMNLPLPCYGRFVCVSETPPDAARRALPLRKVAFPRRKSQKSPADPPRSLPVHPHRKRFLPAKLFLLLYLPRMTRML